MTTAATHLECDDCRARYGLLDPVNTCRGCGGLLDAVYDLEGLRQRLDLDAVLRRPNTVWRWRELLPLVDDNHRVTLGEGGSPLLMCERVGEAIGLRRLAAKNDAMNPTASFKDRSFTISVSKAKELGVRLGFTYTSGNAGASFAAYMAKARIPSVVLVKDWATREKIAMIRIYGCRTVILSYDSFAEVTRMLEEAVKRLGIYQFVLFINPYRHEGYKSYAYELWNDLGRRVPDWVIQPVSNGGGLYGLWKGFRELKALGLADRLPRLVACQPTASPPIVRAFEAGKTVAERFGDPRASIAQSIGSDAPIGGGRRILRALADTRGRAVAATDSAMLEAMALLGRDGLFVEPSSAITVAAAKQLASEGIIGPEDRVVCILTGSGLKQPAAVDQVFPQGLEHIHARIEELEPLLLPTGGEG
ncbi:MAG: hypothetical protein A3G35_16150 [candidate division NC10 bacterium RIFCSPLOWO2_12_FULL_66_18]|nr:MAG: hypothetical protein A3G35_16150 [candidate division NC10 bacterium RIFCSPLOWO2_12_FULL_66_18]